MKKAIKVILLISLVFIGLNTISKGAEKKTVASKSGEYILTDFGKATTPKEAQATMDKACKQIIANGGGTLIVPPGVADTFEIRNTYQQDRKSGPTVTIIDTRKGYRITHVPQVGKMGATGWFGEYKYRYLNLEQSLPHCGVSNIEGKRNALIKGAGSYMQKTLKAVKKGKDVKIYVPSIRGLFPGFYLNLTGTYFGYGQPYDIIRVKTLGWDAKLKMDYITADLKYDHIKGVLLYNKHVTGTSLIETSSNCDNQSMEFQVVRNQYAQGDSFAISSMYSYQGDVFSGLGDEMGVGINSEIAQDIDPFRSKVESVNWKTDSLKFIPGVCNIQKIATSRPLINHNPKKWITKGDIVIVPPEDWFGTIIKNSEINPKNALRYGIDLKKISMTFKKDGKVLPTFTNYLNLPVKKFKYTYQGKTYPSIIAESVNVLGGYIEGSKDCGWTEAIVGRFFAVAQKGEFLSPKLKVIGTDYGGGALKHSTYRWYKIKDFRKNKNGTSTIKIERIRWAAVNAGAPVLYDFENYTWDGHVKALKYIIAPGAYVYDISKAWEDRIQQGGVVYKTDLRTIKLSPSPDRGTFYDFAPGDKIVQAIGADPAIPKPIRIRMFNHTPGTMESSGIEIINHGRVGINRGISFAGSTGISKDNIKLKMDKKPDFLSAVDIGTVTENAINFGADVTNAALYFYQPHERAQPIKWRHNQGFTTLAVDPKNTRMSIKGSALEIAQIANIKGISGTDKAANNLRGIDVLVVKGIKKIKISFKTPELDAKYSLSILPSWFTQFKLKEKKASGFTVEFSNPAPANAKIDWQMIR